MGFFHSNSHGASRQEADGWMECARKLFETRRMGSPTVDEIEAILLLTCTPVSTFRNPEAMYTLTNYGIKLCERVCGLDHCRCNLLTLSVDWPT
jgi:hypothetical protein